MRQGKERNSRYIKTFWYQILNVGMYKDQIYLMGALEILRNRRRLNLVHLHSGKITVEDCLRLS